MQYLSSATVRWLPELESRLLHSAMIDLWYKSIGINPHTSHCLKLRYRQLWRRSTWLKQLFRLNFCLLQTCWTRRYGWIFIYLWFIHFNLCLLEKRMLLFTISWEKQCLFIPRISDFLLRPVQSLQWWIIPTSLELSFKMHCIGSTASHIAVSCLWKFEFLSFLAFALPTGAAGSSLAAITCVLQILVISWWRLTIIRVIQALAWLTVGLSFIKITTRCT